MARKEAMAVPAMGSLFAAAALWSSTAWASPEEPDRPRPVTPSASPGTVTILETSPGPVDEPDEYTQFDDSFDLYLVPGVLNMPFAGQSEVDYGAIFDPGYQWGLGLGYFNRTDSAFALGFGAYFDHAILNAEGRTLRDITRQTESIFRTGLEVRPGIVVAERVFINVPVRGGYAADVRTVERNDVDADVQADHGLHLGVAGGLDVAIYQGLYLGTAAGVDMHVFRGGRDYNMHAVAWRALLGYRF